MFERFTDRARRVIVLAQEHARLFKSREIHSAHLLLALISEEHGIAARALALAGVNGINAHDAATETLGVGDATPSGFIPFTPSSKKVLELALRESLGLGHRHIGTEHLLLGLIREGTGSGVQVLEVLGTDRAALRKTTCALITNESATIESDRTVAYRVEPEISSPAGPALTQITVHVNDLEHSRRFYTAAGLELAEPEHPLGITCAGAMLAPGVCLFLVQRADAVEPSAGISLRLLVDSIGPAVAALEGLGEAKGIDCPGGTWAFTDPDGNTVVLVPRYGVAA
ncbi:Probable ATP-dependent Clp protease ATP-binding subunit (plasmid) [Tsukamurella tyrosinosolvens]|uniref:Clp amino terminal domain-containing protein, pathogenicity island component n=1 Tax=Tsukamurella tyrosinosolvens TaxID=57704 RepID=A0A1H4V5C8_TSUTY|nr:Clp protease N-terminal domain-containing protein [Tsukamurella tyrosinosolvens]KXO91045.1 hypothetical protein AXK58_21685 [Tsukamurella tyrosinosolvens]SEC76123.1 Clp amino terminal domain-containing protein, pathogenicity island component [Tsukamurella tyrosinosolvens]VEH90679.1 Probable ATP-dependent Clp protease ATP-binding subunit [Tsukamurella tyrosinosolvens]